KLQHDAPLEWCLTCEDSQPRACIPKGSTRSAKSTLTRVQVHAHTASQYAYTRVKAMGVSGSASWAHPACSSPAVRLPHSCVHRSPDSRRRGSNGQHIHHHPPIPAGRSRSRRRRRDRGSAATTDRRRRPRPRRGHAARAHATVATGALLTGAAIPGRGEGLLAVLILGTAQDAAGRQVIAGAFMEEHPDIPVLIQSVQATDWGDFFAKILTMVASGTAPDVVYTATEGAQLFAERLALPLDEYIRRDADEMRDYF